MNEYPTAKQLERIERWSIKTRRDSIFLLDYINGIWKYAEDGYFTKWDENDYRLSTGGWSGNEEIIEAMKKNTMFWTLCWHSSRRGGHHVFGAADIVEKQAMKI